MKLSKCIVCGKNMGNSLSTLDGKPCHSKCINPCSTKQPCLVKTFKWPTKLQKEIDELIDLYGFPKEDFENGNIIFKGDFWLDQRRRKSIFTVRHFKKEDGRWTTECV